MEYTFKCPKCGGTDLTCVIGGVTELCTVEIDCTGYVCPGDTIELFYGDSVAVYTCSGCGAEFKGVEAVKPFIVDIEQPEEQ